MMGTIVFLSFLILVPISSDRCCEINFRDYPKYHLLKSGARSDKMIISRRAVSDLEGCKKFAASKMALAFNFNKELVRKAREGLDRTDNRGDPYHVSCLVLDCPERADFSSLVEDAQFDYYSSYVNRRQLSMENLTCIPYVGMFIFFEEHLNYTNARLACQKLHGSLAHVISEKRSNELVKFVGQSATFVGLSKRNPEKIWKNEFDEPLTCFEYRAWDVGEPQRSQGCVSIVRSKDGFEPVWQTTRCGTMLPYICEILPMGSGRRG